MFPGLSKASMYRILKVYQAQKDAGVQCPGLSAKRKGRCGRPSLLTPELRQHYKEKGQEYADMWILLTADLCVAELAQRWEGGDLGMH